MFISLLVQQQDIDTAAVPPRQIKYRMSRGDEEFGVDYSLASAKQAKQMERRRSNLSPDALHGQKVWISGDRPALMFGAEKEA